VSDSNRQKEIVRTKFIEKSSCFLNPEQIGRSQI